MTPVPTVHRPFPARWLAGVVLACALAPAEATAQEGCEAIAPGNDLTVARTIGGVRITSITNPHFLCAGGVEIFADSAEAFPDRGMSHLIGNVRYIESARELLADDARYFTNEGRLQASGNLRLTDEEQGSSIVNGDLVYLLQTDFRDVAELTVTTGSDGLRPIAILRPPAPAPDTVGAPTMPDSAGDRQAPDSVAGPEVQDSVAGPEVPDSVAVAPAGPPEPYTVVGDRIFMLDSGYFTATGTVEIQQDSLRAFADSAEYDAEGAGLVLEGSARVVSAGYDLVGRSIVMSRPGADDSRVHAMREARLQGDDLLLTSAQIFLFLLDGALERLVATPIAPARAINADSTDTERPRAVVQDFVLTSDSLEVRTPGQTVERVFAAGRARSESAAGDSLNVDLLPEVARSDWLEGDTVVVTFALPEPAPSAPAAETERRRLEVDQIVAQGNASTLYRLPPNDSTARPGTDPPAVHYVVGAEIRIRMQDREVSSMEVIGQTRGVHLEPLQRRTAPPDSLPRADTTGAVVDTATVGRTTENSDTAVAIDTLLLAGRTPGRGLAPGARPGRWPRAVAGPARHPAQQFSPTTGPAPSTGSRSAPTRREPPRLARVRSGPAHSPADRSGGPPTDAHAWNRSWTR